MNDNYEMKKDIEDAVVRALKWSVNDDEKNADVLERICLSVAIVICAMAKGDTKVANKLFSGSEAYIAGKISSIIHIMRP